MRVGIGDNKFIITTEPKTQWTLSWAYNKKKTKKTHTHTHTHKLVLNLSRRLDLRSLNKYVALYNLSIYYTWKYIRQQQKNNKLEIIAEMWNDEFELPNGSYCGSDIQDYIE